MTVDRAGVAETRPETLGQGAEAPGCGAVAAHQRPIVGALEIPRSGPAVSTRELDDLARTLSERLAAELAPASGPLEVDRRRLVEALRCPARTEGGPDAPFEWDAVKAHRRLGLRALQAMHRSGQEYPDALEGVGRAIDLEIDEGTRLGEWLTRLGPAGRSAVLAAASGFAARHWIALPWDRCGRVQFGSRRHRVSLPEPAERVTLDVRLDATIFVSDPPEAERVIVTMGQTPPEGLRFDILVSSLHLRRVPRRAIAVDPAAGQPSSVDVDAGLLETAAEELVRAARALTVRTEDGKLRALPGPSCPRCPNLGRCAPGGGWVAAQTRRVAGIPVGATGPRGSAKAGSPGAAPSAGSSGEKSPGKRLRAGVDRSAP
jgi:hypothetical protein